MVSMSEMPSRRSARAKLLVTVAERTKGKRSTAFQRAAKMAPLDRLRRHHASGHQAEGSHDGVLGLEDVGGRHHDGSGDGFQVVVVTPPSKIS